MVARLSFYFFLVLQATLPSFELDFGGQALICHYIVVNQMQRGRLHTYKLKNADNLELQLFMFIIKMKVHSCGTIGPLQTSLLAGITGLVYGCVV